MKLDEFLVENREAVLKRCRESIRKRNAPRPSDDDLEQDLAQFYEEVIDILRKVEASDAGLAPAPSLVPSPPTLHGEGAARHGRNLQRRGFSLTQVVHVYGTICDSVTSLAEAKGFVFTAAEFNLFNRCLDSAVGQAVGEFERQRDENVAVREVEHLGALAHELRNTLAGAMAATSMIKRGVVPVGGRTAAVLEKSLVRMRDLIDRSLTEVRLRSDATPRREPVDLDKVLEQVALTMMPQAESRDVRLEVEAAPGIQLEADSQMLLSAIANLVQNGVKFTKPTGRLAVRAKKSGERLTLEVEDECGGLSPEVLEGLRQPGSTVSTDPQGLGLGLRIARKAIALHRGTLEVRNLPDKGCVFVIDLPLRLAGGQPM